MKRSTLESASIFHGCDVYCSYLVDKRFRDDTFERTALLQTCKAAGQIWALQYHLNRIHTALERLSAIGMEPMASNGALLEKLSEFPKEIFEHEWMRETVEQAPDMLRTWCSIYPLLQEIMSVSVELRLLGCRPSGQA